MPIRIEADDEKITAFVSGEIDHHTAKAMREELDERIRNSSLKKLDIDFSEVSFMDSSGIGFVMGRYKLVKEFGGTVEIKNPPLQIKKVLRLSGLDKIVKL